MAHAALGIDERDDLFNVVNVGELVIEPGGRVIVQGNLLVFGCQYLRHLAAAAHDARDYQLGVLPTPHTVDRRIGPRHGRAGATGTGGGPGRTQEFRPAGAPTMIGFALSEPLGDRMNGSDGADGAPGGAGEPGRTGGATKTAEITIGRLTGRSPSWRPAAAAVTAAAAAMAATAATAGTRSRVSGLRRARSARAARARRPRRGRREAVAAVTAASARTCP